MKNLTKFFVAVAALFVGVSCVNDTTEDLGQQIVGQGQTVLTVAIGEPETKTSLGEKIGDTYPVYWSEGDKLSWNGVASVALTEVAEKSKVAIFTWESELEGPAFLAYPESAEGTVTFAKSQKFVEGSFAQNAVPMYAYTEGGLSDATLNYLAGVLRVGIYAAEETTIKSFTIENLDGDPIAGVFECSNDGELTATDDVTATINYSAEGVVLSQDETAPTYFHVAVPAGSYDALRLTILTDKGVMVGRVRAGEGKEPIAAGVVRDLKAVAFNANSGIYFDIDDEADLNALRNMSADDCAAFDLIRVTKDITVSEDFAPIADFAGNLDGANHTISGLKAPLFAKISGTVSNLNVDATINETANANVGLLARELGAEAYVFNCHTSGSLTFSGAHGKVGGIVGYAPATTATTTTENEDGSTSTSTKIDSFAIIEKCVNNAAITITGTSSGKFGGITGDSQARILECTNKGTILFAQGSTIDAELYVGGISGHNHDASYISYCTNDAPITLAGTVADSTTNKEFYVGGLLGQHSRTIGSSSVAPRDSENTENGVITIGGTITLRECTPASGQKGAASTTDNYQCWGGLFGRSNQNGATRCVNRGTLLVTATFTNDTAYSNADSHVRISPWIGGIYGHGTTDPGTATVNYGSVVWMSKDCKFDILLGGIIGRSSVAVTSKHYGTVKCEGTTSCNVYMGGVAPILNTASSTAENHGVVEYAESASCKKLYIGGYAGSANLLWYEGTAARSVHYAMTGSSNYGKIIVNGDTTNTAMIGGITGYVGKAALTNCHNKVDSNVEGSGSITVGSTSSTSSVYIGGIIASQASEDPKAVITECTNEGAIKYDGTASGASLFLGGIAGGAPYTNGKVTGCRNTGSVSVDSNANCKIAYVGGIAGAANDQGKLNVSDCVNGTVEGNGGFVTFKGKTSSNMYVGGVAGYTKSAPTLTTSTNYGTILAEATNGATGYVGGIAGYTAGDGEVTALKNYGDITINCTKAVTCGGIGALAGKNEITNSESICNLKSNDTSNSGASNLGMFNGYAATATRKVSNCKVGGTIQRKNDVSPVTITDGNYANYLFSGNPTYPAIEDTNYSNITVVTPAQE